MKVKLCIEKHLNIYFHHFKSQKNHQTINFCKKNKKSNQPFCQTQKHSLRNYFLKPGAVVTLQSDNTLSDNGINMNFIFSVTASISVPLLEMGLLLISSSWSRETYVLYGTSWELQFRSILYVCMSLWNASTKDVCNA